MPTDNSIEMTNDTAHKDEVSTHQQLTTQNETDNTYIIDIWLKNKSHYCLQLEKVFVINFHI